MSQNVLLSHWKVFCAILLLFLLITHNLFLRFRVFNISVYFPSPALHHMLFCCVHNRSQVSPRPSAHHSQPMLLSKIGLFAPTLICPGISLTYDQKMITPISHIILKSEKRNEFDDKKDGGEGSDLKNRQETRAAENTN